MAPIARIDLSKVQFTPELLSCIPAATAQIYRVLPVFDAGATLGIVMTDPSNLDVIDALFFLLGRQLQVQQVDPQQLDTFIQRLYGEHHA
jgi:hypothetical protein